MMLEMGVHEYQFVRRYLERCPQGPLTLQQVNPLIRELIEYRDLINTEPRRKRKVNLVEVDRALRHLRLGGIAAIQEKRLRQAQSEAIDPNRLDLQFGLR
jgi:hypothetical protein